MLGSKSIIRKAAIAATALSALALVACTDVSSLPKEARPLDKETRDLISTRGMSETGPILIRIFKEDSTLEVWKKRTATGRYALLKTYDICKWSGELGPKVREGDRQAPEGFYTISPAQLNPKSSYHLSFNLGYPNAYDQSLGRTGSHLMVHGACSSRGCYSMDDEQIQEIYTLARLAFQGGQRSFQVQALPFRMTPENMAKYRKNPNMEFWQMLKVGYDHFEVTGQEPKVDVCSTQYVFNSVPEGGMSFSPTADCPPMSVPPSIQMAVAEKEQKDQAQMMVIAARLEQDEAKELARQQREETERAAQQEIMTASLQPAPAASAPASPAPAASTSEAAAAASADAQPATPAVQTAYVAPQPSSNPLKKVTGFFGKLFN